MMTHQMMTYQVMTYSVTTWWCGARATVDAFDKSMPRTHNPLKG
jgi:hypothetical protein